MKSKNFVTSVLLSVFMLFLVSCKPAKEDWNSPKKIYELMCACKNGNGLTVDEQLVADLKTKGIEADNSDKINTYISSNTNEFMKMVDEKFLNDTVYLQNLISAKDTLTAHGSSLEVKGALGDLFSVKAKYPACVAGLPYITQ